MAGEDKTAALVVALSAQLTKFERDMKRAGDIADREVNNIEKKFSSLNPGLSNSFFGNLFSNIATRGLEQAVKLVSDLVDRVVDLEKASKLLQVSMNDLFGVQQAATEFGVPIEEANSSLRTMADLLNRMQRGEKNSLSDLFDANPQALKGVNREALTLQQTLEIVERLLQNLNRPLDKIDAGKLAGFTEAMSLAVGKSESSFAAIAQKASETAPDLQKMADSARQFEDLISKAGRSLKDFLAQQTMDFFKSTIQDLEAMIRLSVKFLSLFEGGPLGDLAAGSAAELKALQDVIDESKKPTPRRVTVTGGTVNRGSTNIPQKSTGTGETLDAFDRTEESITRHTASLKADTIAVTENSAVQAQLRAEFQLLNAIRKDEGEVTQAQIDQYTRLRETMSAQQALEASGIQLTKEHAAAFLSASEGARAAQAAYTAAADGVARLNSASQQLGSALANSFSDAIVEGKKLDEVFSSLLKTIAKAGINSVFSSIFSPQAGGGLSPFASLFRFAEGGRISGPGGPRSDSILARVSNGEYIMNAAATSKYLPWLEAMNAKRFADGGLVYPGGDSNFEFGRGEVLK